MFLPKALYEILPRIYFIMGVLAVIFLDVWGRIGGVVLLCTSVWVLDHRSIIRALNTNRPLINTDESVDSET